MGPKIRETNMDMEIKGRSEQDHALRSIPAGRFGEPDEFGAACAFLCSAHAGYLTGQNIVLDGGSYLGML
jgi:NAD(P)-dependent dehydrogenase (short-subunit alcohol dehydrogenase family)